MLDEPEKVETANAPSAVSERPPQESNLDSSKPLHWADLYGVAREIWKGIDAQEYVDRLRDGENDNGITG
jgi:hypothetical protein